MARYVVEELPGGVVPQEMDDTKIVGEMRRRLKECCERIEERCGSESESESESEDEEGATKKQKSSIGEEVCLALMSVRSAGAGISFALFQPLN